MPQIPRDSGLQQISMDVPSADIHAGQAGQVQEALSRAGSQLANTAVPMVAQVKQLEAQDASDEAFNKDQIDANKYLTELKLKNPDGVIKDPDTGMTISNADGSPRTITQQARDDFNSRFEDNQKNMPSLMAQQIYKEKASRFYSSQIDATYNQEQELKLKSFESNQVARDQSRADFLVSQQDPNLRSFYDASNESKAELQSRVGKLYTQSFANDKMLKNDQQFAQSHVEAWVNQAISIPKKGESAQSRIKLADQALSILDENPNDPRTLSPDSFVRKVNGLPILSEMLQPDQKETLIKKLIAAKTQVVQYGTGSYNIRLGEARARLSQGGVNQDPTLLQDGATLVKNGALDPLKYAQDAGSLTLAQKLAQLPQGMRLLPEERQRSIVQSVVNQTVQSAQNQVGGIPGSGNVGQELAKTGQKTGQDFIDAGTKMLKDDWQSGLGVEEKNTQKMNAILMKNNVNFSDPRTLKNMGPLLNDQIQKSESLYAQRFPNDPSHFRVLTKDQSVQAGKFLSSVTGSVDDQAYALRTMAQEYGSNYPRIMQQMIEDGSLDKKWYFAAVMGNSQTLTADMVASIKASPKSGEMDAMESSSGLSGSTINNGLQSKFGSFMQAVSQQSPGDPFSQMKQDSILSVAKHKALSNLASGYASSFDQAVGQAYDSLVGNNWFVEKVPKSSGFLGSGLFAGSYSMVIPKNIAGYNLNEDQAKNITSFSQHVLTPEGLKSVLGQVPSGPGGKKSNFPKEFYDQVADTGRVTVNSKQRGLEVWWLDKNTNSPKQVLGPNGKALLIPIDQAIQYRPVNAKVQQYSPSTSFGGK